MDSRITPAWRMSVSRTKLSVVGFILVGVVSGCGYSTQRPFRMTGSDGREIRTIAIDIFQSREFRRGLELQLAEAVMKRVEAETPYRLAHRERADTLLTGEIKEVRQGTLGRDLEQNRPRETAMTIVISFEWKDLRTGATLVKNDNFIQTVDYVRPLDESFYNATQRGMNRMAERLVEQMETDW